MCADATNPSDVETLMDGKQANPVVTDPPYNVDFKSSSSLKIAGDKQDADTFYRFLPAAFTNMAASPAKGGSAYVFHADTEGLNFRRAFQDAGFYLSGCCIWIKDSLVLAAPHISGSTNRYCMGGKKTALTRGMRTANKPRCGILPSRGTTRIYVNKGKIGYILLPYPKNNTEDWGYHGFGLSRLQKRKRVRDFS